MIMKNTIITGGRLEKWKGISVVVEIIAELEEEYPGMFKLEIIGEGPEKENIKRQIKELGIKNNVKMLGKLSHEELIKLFKS